MPSDPLSEYHKCKCKGSGARAQIELNNSLMRLAMAYLRPAASGENVLFGLITPWAAYRRQLAWQNLGRMANASDEAKLNKERGIISAHMAALRGIMKGQSGEQLSLAAVPTKEQAFNFVLTAVETIRVEGGEVDGELDGELDSEED